ncbi:MAG: DUF3107 domain-containing protein [Actinomycetota bacterium]
MDVRIGVVYTTRELVIETDESVEQVSAAVDAALGGQPALWLNDNKGRRIAIPTDKIAYVEVASDAGERQVGFGNR